MHVKSNKISRICETPVKGFKGAVTHKLRTAVLIKPQSKEIISLWNII